MSRQVYVFNNLVNCLRIYFCQIITHVMRTFHMYLLFGRYNPNILSAILLQRLRTKCYVRHDAGCKNSLMWFSRIYHARLTFFVFCFLFGIKDLILLQIPFTSLGSWILIIEMWNLLTLTSKFSLLTSH